METVTLTIDGRALTVEKGQTVLQAAVEHGIQVPFYCYHPGLGIDGSCRVCIVKIEKMPKLQTSCSTPVAEGMIVHTKSPDVIEARAGVFEFLLINHPLDCPVCDKGGECPLQDFSYAFGPERSRMEFPRRTFDGEGVKADVDFGPTLMLNRNRCILCTRCVRFMREVDTDAQIGIVDRGYGSEIATFREEGVHSLISGNLMDVCPVGAITTRDYRFKSRPWDNPHAVDTVCTQCSKGCNTTAWIKAKPEWAKGARLVRFTPRFNPDVNGYWMCDIGRFEYHWIEGDERLKRPLARGTTGALEPVGWRDALATLRARTVGDGHAKCSLAFLASAHASLEELFLLKRMADASGQGPLALGWQHREKDQPSETRFRVPATDAPNVNGARDLGIEVGSGHEGPHEPSALRQAVESGSVKALYVFDPGPVGSLGDIDWLLEARRSNRLTFLVVHGVLFTPLAAAADLVLPGSCSVEKDALYTNDQGRVQAASRVIPAPGEALEDWLVLTRVGQTLGIEMDFMTAADVRAAIGRMLIDKSAYSNLERVSFARPVTARTWLQTSNPSERWKWDFLFQDVPPVKFAPEDTDDPQRSIIPLRPIATLQRDAD